MSEQTRDEWLGRMLHVALEEKLGGKAPPDVADRVLNRPATDSLATAPPASSALRMALAVCLILGLGLLAVLAGSGNRGDVVLRDASASLSDRVAAIQRGELAWTELSNQELRRLSDTQREVVGKFVSRDYYGSQEPSKLDALAATLKSEEANDGPAFLRILDDKQQPVTAFMVNRPDAARRASGDATNNLDIMYSVTDVKGGGARTLGVVPLYQPPSADGTVRSKLMIVEALADHDRRDAADKASDQSLVQALELSYSRQPAIVGSGSTAFSARAPSAKEPFSLQGVPGKTNLNSMSEADAAKTLNLETAQTRYYRNWDSKWANREIYGGLSWSLHEGTETKLKQSLSGKPGADEFTRGTALSLTTKSGDVKLKALAGSGGDGLAVIDKERAEDKLAPDRFFDGEFEQPPGAKPVPEGQGPGQGGDKFRKIVDNPFKAVLDEPLSTFSIDVDTAAYSKVRALLLDHGSLPPPDAVRIEELVNYFQYDYAPPTGPDPFAVHLEVAACPWEGKHRLVRVGIKGKTIESKDRPAGNFVFLLDVSGSMNEPRKLPLVKQGMKLLTRQLNERDRVAIVVYAGASGLVLESTPGSAQERILAAIDQLQPGGSTNGAAGIQLAYQIAQDRFLKEGVNRVILCTDGDFNVGMTSDADLQRLIEEKAKTGVFLTCLGFGMGNHNDSMLETLADKGNGNYGYVDTINEAHKLLVDQLNGTLVTIAKDVKIQVEFNPVQVAGYRLLGYENRMLAKEDFNDDKKDAGEIGAGHCVTALYEVVPTGIDVSKLPEQGPAVDALEFQSPAALTDAAKKSGNLLLVKLRYKEPTGDTSKLLKFPVRDEGKKFAAASGELKFAAAVASFGMLLRDSPYKGNSTLAAVLEIAKPALGPDKFGYRAEFLTLVEKAKTLGGK